VPAPFRVLLTDRGWPDAEIERRELAAVGAELVEAPDGAEPTLVALARGVDAIATCWARVTAAVIAAAPHCRLVARLGIGLDNIDVAAATARGVPVTNVPDYCLDEVSEHALALLFACARQVAWYAVQAKSGRYVRETPVPLGRMAGRTLGVVGFGPIGRAVARKAQGLGLKVLACSRSGDDHGTGFPMRSLDGLLAESDYVSLHAPLTPETRKLISAPQLARMKRGAFLINTARGGLVDEAALLAALESGHLGGAALDVFDPEPPDLSAPLFRHERTIVTPHAAFTSVESLADLRTRVARQIVAALRGERPPHVANPAVFSAHPA
jgi:D-3-phosphoglycerate dehydrogenase